jgi:hypothetical protein
MYQVQHKPETLPEPRGELASRMLAMPSPDRPAFAVLLVVTVLRHDEFRLQRHHPVGATTVADTIAWKCSVLSLPRLRGQKAQACGKAR